MGLEKSTKLLQSGMISYNLAFPPTNKLKDFVYCVKSHCPSTLYRRLLCQSAAPPVTGASGVVPDLISQLLILMMVSISDLNAAVPGCTRLWSACALAYWLAAARFAEVSDPPFSDA